MEIKPSFFSVTGFLVPGLVTAFAFAVVWHADHKGQHVWPVSDLYSKDTSSMDVVVIVLLLAVTFVLGCILSDAFILIGRTLITRPLLREKRNAYFARLLKKQSLDELLEGDLNPREAYVYTQTGDLDLNWYAGRIRMVGGSGLGLFFVAIYAVAADQDAFGFSIFAVSVISMGLAIYRSHKFDQYVAATAAVLRFAPGKRQKDD
jgi:hypothetical protein